MADQRIPPAPQGARAAGKRLWRSILAEYELEEHELALLREMVRTVDQLDQLQAAVDRDGLVVRGQGLAQRVHPAAVEARQARIALARLAAALRLPAGEEGSDDAKVGTRRPQRRAGVRGPYRLRGVS
jgi:terminase small subunit-like protein